MEKQNNGPWTIQMEMIIYCVILGLACMGFGTYEELHFLATGQLLLAVGLAIVSLALVAGLATYVTRLWKEHQRHQQHHPTTSIQLQNLES